MNERKIKIVAASTAAGVLVLAAVTSHVAPGDPPDDHQSTVDLSNRACDRLHKAGLGTCGKFVTDP